LHNRPGRHPESGGKAVEATEPPDHNAALLGDCIMANAEDSKSSNAEQDLYKNPLIDVVTRGTISNVIGALQWLNSVDQYVDDAYCGEPTDAIKTGRFFLGKCCINALEAALHEMKQNGGAEAVRHG
jgi:hypothetical protein